MSVIQAPRLRDESCYNPIARLLHGHHQHRFQSSDERLPLGLGSTQLRSDRGEVSHSSVHCQQTLAATKNNQDALCSTLCFECYSKVWNLVGFCYDLRHCAVLQNTCRATRGKTLYLEQTIHTKVFVTCSLLTDITLSMCQYAP